MKFSSYVKLKEQKDGQAPAQAQGQQNQQQQNPQNPQQAQQGQQAPPVDPATALKTLGLAAKGNKGVIDLLQGIGRILGLK